MRLVVADPAELAVTFEDADAQLRLEGDDSEKDYIEGLIAAVIGELDGGSGWLGRNLTRRQVDLFLAGISEGGEIPLPLGPVGAILSIELRDPSTGAWVLVPQSTYELRGETVSLAWQKSWPSFAAADEAVHVSYEAGFPTLPPPLKIAVLLMVTDLYENRSASVDPRATDVSMSSRVEKMLWPFRRW